MAVNAEWHHSRSSDLSYSPHLSEYGVIGRASTEAPSNDSLTLNPLTPYPSIIDLEKNSYLRNLDVPSCAMFWFVFGIYTIESTAKGRHH